MNTIHSTGQDVHWQQLGTTHILVNVTRWLHRTCSVASWFHRVSKMPAMNALLAIYTHMLGISSATV